MRKRSYVLLVALLTALSAFSVADAPELRRVGSYSLQDSLALLLCNPAQMYACGYGDPWNGFTSSFLAVLLCAGIFVYSNSYAYPEGFRTLSILRFGSEARYWRQTLRRSGKYVLFAATVCTAAAGIFGAAAQARAGFGAVRFVTLRPFAAVYLLFWLKLAAALALVAVSAEVFAGRLSRAGMIGAIIVGTVLLLAVDVMQGKTALLALGSWQEQAAAIVGFLAVQLALLLYGRVRPLPL